MKKILIKSILPYGREYHQSEQIYYINLDNLEIYDKDELISVWGFEEKTLINLSELHMDFHIVPVFRVDMISLMREFLLGLHNRKITNDINDLNSEQLYIYFQKYTETNLVDFFHWRKYEENALVNAAISWCNYLHIPYLI